jgi:RNA polymerase sigma factor (sigma-70 family)
MDLELGLATVRAAAAGDAAAFTRIVARYHADMARVAFVVVGDADLAQDAVQSAWSIAWRRLGTHRESSGLRPWLLAIVANEARQLARKNRRRSLKEIPVESVPGQADPTTAFDWSAHIDIGRVLDRLTVEDRTLLALRFVAGMDSTEISHVIGGSASGIRSRLARLLHRIREDLDHA